MLRIKSNFSDLEKIQMNKISELQEQIKLLQFDKSQDAAIIRDLKSLLVSKKKNIIEIIKELNAIEKNSDYERLDHIKSVLGIIAAKGMPHE